MEAGNCPRMRSFSTLLLISLFTSGLAAREVKVRDMQNNISASIVPAGKWCSAVVSAEIRGKKEDLIKDSKKTQTLIFGTQIAVAMDCPQAELFRIRGVHKGESHFLAYLEKADDWQNIIVVESDPEVLGVLRINQTKEESIRKIALLETKTHMARIGIAGIEYEAEPKDKEDIRQNWKLQTIQGSTFVIPERKQKFETLLALANIFADAAMKECEEVDRLSSDSLKSGIEIRGFDCKFGDAYNSQMILVSESGKMARVMHTKSENKPDLIKLNQLLADGSVLY